MKITFISILLVSIFFTTSCEKKVSKYQDQESHNLGEDCMKCHKSGGTGEGHFKVAGSVFDSTFINANPNTTINIYSEPNGGGKLLKTMEVDGLGNFYSTQKIKKLNKGAYPSVVGHDGVERYMSSALTKTNCNSCHGVTTARIWAN
jgi:hypothetical protein